MGTNIVGSDGITPVYQPNLRWSMWSINEIYFGQQGNSHYVPNVHDWVIDPDTTQRWRVVSVDETTLVPTLSEITEINIGEFSDIDILLGVGPGTESDTFRVYIDKSVVPYTLSVDSRLFVYGSSVTKCIIFKGSELDGTAKAISAIYDQTNTLLGQAIPLELVAMPVNEFVNYSVKCIPTCYTVEDLSDGEVVTAVFYSADSVVKSKRQLLVENTAFIRSPSDSVKYIIGIDMESPFMSKTDNRLLNYPLNVTLNGLNLIGVVNYSDGSKLRLPVDGSKFSLFGLDGYLSTIVGQEFDLVLKYNLSIGEVVYGSNVVEGDKFITQRYKGKTVKADGAFTVKLFGYPVWIDGVNGYRLEWFMYDLNRTNFYQVTPYVRINENLGAFDPKSYGINQQLVVSINLQDVNGFFSNYIHSQTINIALMAPGTVRTTNWTVAFDPNQTPRFGNGNYAVSQFINQNLCKIKVDSGYANQTAWLDHLYKYSKPLFDNTTEIYAPLPNYFAVVIGTDRLIYPISDWNKELTIENSIPDSSTLFIDFILRTSDNDIHLGMGAMPVYQSN